MKCKICGYIKKDLQKGVCYSCSKKESKPKMWDDCICHNQNYHTFKCKRNHRENIRKIYYEPKRKERRHKLRAEHRCIWCKKKVKPVITYPQFCEKHSQKNRNKLKKLTNEN